MSQLAQRERTVRTRITHEILGYIAFTLVFVLCTVPAAAQLSPPDAIGLMGRGINLGNTLEPPLEGSWNNGPAQEYYFDDYRAAGFSTVRIPVRWDEHTADTSPFAIDASWLNRVEQIVDWGLARDLFIIINGHHEDWLKQNYASATLRSRYDSIWSQVATRFKDKSEKLFFEVINEPSSMTRQEVDDLNARTIGIIRRTNPTRIVIFSGNEYSNSPQLLAAAIPNDPYLMGYFHSYDPWSFAGLKQGSWGTSADRSALAAKFQSVADWSAANSIPVMSSEFRAIHGGDFNSRMRHYAAYVEESLLKGFAFQAWDDGGDFRIYLRDERNWNETKDILMHTYPDGPTGLATSVQGDSVLTLSWTNRTVSASSITIERKSPGGGFIQVGRVSGDAALFSDSTVSGGQTYLYRVIANSTTQPAKFSYPIEVRVAPTRAEPIPEADEVMDVYPNPAANRLVVTYRDNKAARLAIELYDVLGRLVVDSKLNDGVTTVELDHVPRGVYVARVLVGGRVVGHRAVVRN